jgi:hypothetical protein
MKKSARITLTVVATMGLAGCIRRHPDPCESVTFNEQACQDAVRNGGYYWGGSWIPMGYRYPYPFYYDSYRSYVSSGGTVEAAPTEAYGRTFGGHSPSSGVERGGFGGIGAGHGAGE